MTPNLLITIQKRSSWVMKLLPVVAFAVPLLWLYLLEPASFELMWKGRTFELFFIWLVSLELILGWEELQLGKINKLYSVRTAAFGVATLLPSIYVAASYYWGLNEAISNWTTLSGVTWANSMPLSTEYLRFRGLLWSDSFSLVWVQRFESILGSHLLPRPCRSHIHDRQRFPLWAVYAFPGFRANHNRTRFCYSKCNGICNKHNIYSERH